MNDAAQPDGDWIGASRPADAPGGAGALLRQARETAGLHIEVLAATLKVPVSKLAALEGDRLHELPDAVFARALAASVCRTLGIEPGVVLERMPRNPSPRLAQDDESINTPFRGSREIYRASPWSQVSRPVVLVVLALLLAALVLIFLPSMRHDTGASTSTAAPHASAATDAARAAPKDGQAAPAEVRTPVAQPAAPTPVAEAPGANPAARIVAAAAPASLAPALAMPPPAAAATGSPARSVADATPAVAPAIVVTARADSWVEVKDAQGKILVRENMAPAQVAQASGALPLSVVIGRADAVAVRVKGQPFDLGPATRNNVARFEVK
ncbi:MAG: putative membrane protein [Burkholderiaceae bacterium]|jgi:cytoskeleton protein RodZ|nr:MAG: putative membrane protein [Burkholderiaceae bacterium]